MGPRNHVTAMSQFEAWLFLFGLWFASLGATLFCVFNWVMYFSDDDPLGPRSFQSFGNNYQTLQDSLNSFVHFPHVFTVITIATLYYSIRTSKAILKTDLNSKHLWHNRTTDDHKNSKDK
ncbi:hypothetical protein AB1L42_07955 [Thalassoglobus sp. JC818]|uniref:hypothetical protein n=1 Tax=Thalassoglobus sp. JC818 TaxID=3232136 RepID=UPI0034585889